MLNSEMSFNRNCTLIAHSAKVAIKLLYLYIVMAALIGATLRNLLDKMYQVVKIMNLTHETWPKEKSKRGKIYRFEDINFTIIITVKIWERQSKFNKQLLSDALHGLCDNSEDS